MNDGKSGINFILIIIAVLFVVAGVAFCVLFGINMTIPGRTYDVAINLYIGLAAIALGALMLIGCNIATNVRISADNSYDIMRAVEILCKKEGITMADLARRDARAARREAALLEQAEARQAAEQQAAAAQAAAEAEQAAAPVVEDDVDVAADDVDIAAPEAPATAPEAPAPTPAPAPEAPVADAPMNCGISYADWKTLLEPIPIVCGLCNGPMQVRITKKGAVVLVCRDKAESGCSALPFAISNMAEQFVEWYNIAFEGDLAEFDKEKFAATVGTIKIAGGIANFTAK